MITISILGLLGIFSFGFFISDAILGKKSHILERISVGFLLGSGLFTFIIFLANWWLRIPFKTAHSLLILLLLNAFAFAVNVFVRKIRKEKELFDYNLNFKEGFENLSTIEKIIIGIILFLFLTSLIHNIFWPVSDWDALAVYDFRAKSFVATGFMTDAISRGYFTGYPLYTSLFHTFLYLIGFKNPVFFYAIIYINLVLVFHFIMLKISNNRSLSLVFAAFVSINSSIYTHSQMAYTNLSYSVFLAIGFAYLIYSFCEKKINLNLLYIGVLLVSLASWVRTSEPFWLLSIPFIILFLIYSKKILHTIALLLILYLPRFIWFKFLVEYKISESSYDTGALSLIKGMVLHFFSLNHIKILSYFYTNMLSPYNTLLIVFVISFSLLIYYVFVKKTFRFTLKNNQSIFIFLPSLLVLLSVAIMLLGLYLFMFLFGDIAYEIIGSAERSTMPLIPFILFSIFTNIFFIIKFLTSNRNV